jgi:hypothetical protein
MKRLKAKPILVLIALTFTLASAQDTTGPRPKRARTPEDYQPRTLKELGAKVSSPGSLGNKMETMKVDPDISPSRVHVTYAGLTRKTPDLNKQVINQWTRLYAGAPETYKPYEVDVLFKENGSRYWLTFKKDKLELFWKAIKKNQPVDLFLIRMGSAKTPTGWEPVLLVENFQD